MRVVIAEDSVLLSSGLELLLDSRGFEVVAVVPDAGSFLAAVEEHRPDVTIVDVRLPPTFRDEGIRAVLAARRRHRIYRCSCCRSTWNASTPPSCCPAHQAGSVTC